MNVITLLTVVLTIPSYFKQIHNKLYEEGKNSGNSYLFEYLSDATNSFDIFLNNLYIVIGSSILASVIDPDNPEEKADRIFGEFEESYHVFHSDFRRLIEGILKEKERFSAESGMKTDMVDLFSEFIPGKGLDTTKLMEWMAWEENPYLNNERVFYHRMTGFVKSFAKKELGVKDFSMDELMNDLLVSADQLAGILGLTCISLMGSMKVPDDRNRFI